MHDAVMSLLAVASMALAAFGVGRAALRALRTGEDDPLAVAVWSLALGLVLVGSMLAALGLAGLLSRSAIAVLTMSAGLWGIGELLGAHAALNLQQRLVRSRGDDSDPAASTDGLSIWTIRGAWALAAVVCNSRLLSALAPPTGEAAAGGHLEVAKTWLMDGSLVYLPSSGDTRFSAGTAMWRVWALALDGGVAVQLADWACGLLLGLATVVLARPIVGRRLAWLAGACVLLIPAVAQQMALTGGALPTAVLATLAIAAWRRGAMDDNGSRWWLISGMLLAGVMEGSAMSIALAGTLMAASAAVCWRSEARRRHLLRGVAVMALAAIVVALPMLVCAIECGWQAPSPELIATAGTLSGVAEAQDAWHALLWPDESHAPRLGNGGIPLEDAGCAFLVAAPGLLVARRLRGLGTLLAMAGGFGMLAVCLAPTSIHLSALLIAPTLCVALAWVWNEWRRLPRPAALAAHAILLLVLLVGAAATARQTVPTLGVALGLQTREQYLLSNEPTYNAAALLNQIAGPDTHLLSHEAGGLYFNCRVTHFGDMIGASNQDCSRSGPRRFDPEQLRAAGITHLLLVEPAAHLGFRRGDDAGHTRRAARRPRRHDPPAGIRASGLGRRGAATPFTCCVESRPPSRTFSRLA